jgi:hypothetical protein
LSIKKKGSVRSPAILPGSPRRREDLMLVIRPSIVISNV